MKYLLCLALLICAAITETASATAPNTWILCDTCQSKPDFNNAALIWYGNRTYRTAVEVGNPITGVLYTVHIEYNNGGDPVGWEGDDTIAKSPPSAEIFQLPNGGRIVASTDDSDEGIDAFPPSGYPYVSSSFHDTANEAMFIGYISLAKEGVFYAAVQAPNAYGLDSFAGQEKAEVCRKLWGAATAYNPLWPVAEAYASLRGAIKGYYGRGPYATMVFRNGDMASYEVHFLGPSDCDYIDNSAKDEDNNPLPDDGWDSVAYGGGGHMNISHGGSSAPLGAGTYYSDSYKSCATQGDVFLGCYIY